MKIERFMTAVGIGLFLTLAGCAEYGYDFPGASKHNDGLVFSSDGTLLAPKAGPNPKVWDTKTRKILWEIDRGKDGRVDSVAFSPDGKSLVSGVVDRGHADKPLKLWDAATGELLRTLGEHDDFVHFVGFSPDGKTLVSMGNKNRVGTIQLWDVETWMPLRTRGGHSEYITSVTFSPDGKVLASGSDDATVRLWNAETGKLLQHIKGNEHRKHPYAHLRAVLADAYEHHYAVRAVAFSPDGKALASASVDPIVNLWNVETAAE